MTRIDDRVSQDAFENRLPCRAINIDIEVARQDILVARQHKCKDADRQNFWLTLSRQRRGQCFWLCPTERNAIAPALFTALCDDALDDAIGDAFEDTIGDNIDDAM